ncbi:MAG: 1,4-beta-xylanase [Bacteroidetes bacterium]|nr:1,4-beta-xylanase [Bacteroidota bacterium]
MKKHSLLLIFSLIALVSLAQNQSVWTAAKANEWYQKQPWLVGCNFIPSSAINELEMWQAKTFDLKTIDRELGWANGIGMNVVRVFLHYLPWQEDAKGFKERINKYLAIAAKHHIKTMFVLFDDCWNNDPQLGPQPLPKPGVHNSGWLQCPGTKMHEDSSSWVRLELYTKDILSTFKNDQRILLWDLYNEPGNSDYNETTLPLLKKVFQWAWEVRPNQPLTCGIWNDDKNFRDFQLASSDVISFHNYDKAPELEKEILELQRLGKPLICSEYMARTNGSKFITHLPVFKKYRVGAINWGLVSGKTNTIFPWDSKPGSVEPRVWFHDVFRKDGRPFDPNEVAFIMEICTGNKKY